MEFGRAIIVAVKILLISFFLYLLAGIILLSGNLPVAIVIGFLFTVFGLAVTVYFILEEAEKISVETVNEIRDLKRRVNEIRKTLRKETTAKKEDILIQCPECGKEVPRDFKLCPYCGFDFQQQIKASI